VAAGPLGYPDRAMGSSSRSAAHGEPSDAPSDDGSSWAGRRVLVLGATGFVGGWVTRALGARRAVVHLAARDGAAAAGLLDAPGVAGEVHVVDLARAGAADALLEAARPDVVFSLAGYGVDKRETDEAAMTRLNAELVEEVGRAAGRWGRPRDRGLSLVHVGSAAEYGARADDLVETSEEAPTTPYGVTKLEGARRLRAVCDETGLAAATARLFTVYGPGEHEGRLLPALLDAAERGADLELSAGTQRRDFTYVGDVAEGLLRLAESDAPPGAVVNLATGVLTSVKDFALTAARVLGMPAERLRFGARPPGPFEMEHRPVNVERMTALTGWRATTSVEDGVRATLAHRARSPVR